MNSSPREPENAPLKGKEYPRAIQDTKTVSPENDENITNIVANVIAPSFIGGLGAVGLTAIGLNVPTKTVQTDTQSSPSTTVSSRDYLPSMNMSTGTEFFLYGCILILLATLIGSVGILSLIGVPAKNARSKTWQIGIVYALLFPTAISALIQNQFLGGQQTSVENLVAEQQKNNQIASSNIAEIKKELQKAQQQLRVSTEIIAAPDLYSQPQKNVIMGNQTAIANLDKIQADLDRLTN